MDKQKVKKKARTVSFLKEAAGAFVRFEVDPKAMTTITRAELSDNMQSVKFFVSVFPEEKEKEILVKLNKRNKEFKNYLKSKIRIKSLPDAYFALDKTWHLEMQIDKLSNINQAAA